MCCYFDKRIILCESAIIIQILFAENFAQTLAFVERQRSLETRINLVFSSHRIVSANTCWVEVDLRPVVVAVALWQFAERILVDGTFAPAHEVTRQVVTWQVGHVCFLQ